MPLPEFSGPSLGTKRAAHLLRRATFGPTKQQIDTFASLSPVAAINQLFHQVLPNPVLPIDLKTGQEWVLSGVTNANSEDGDLQEYFKGWFIAQMLSSGISLGLSAPYSAREKIVFFLHSHFTAIQSKISSSRALYFQNQLFRIFALDSTPPATWTRPANEFNFIELTKKVCVDNAMLRLLDGNENVKGSPNENYARELHELYTIGRGLEGSVPATTEPGDYYYYQELDVQEAARVLSGWVDDETFSTLDIDTGLPRGIVKGSVNNASAHDNDPKTFSDRFNGNTIQGDPLLMPAGNPTEASAMDEISQLVDQIYANRETALNICRKLYRFFVYHEITDAINTNIISVMADTLIGNGYKLQPVIENLLRSQHFYDAGAGVTDDNFGGIIKSPLDLVAGTLRLFEFQLPDMTTSTAQFYEQTGMIIGAMGDQSMHFYEPYDVAGYDAYHQYPIYNRSWITPVYLARRYKYIEALISPESTDPINVDVYNWVKNNIVNATASNGQSLIIELANYFFPVPDNLIFGPSPSATITEKRLNYFESELLQGFDEVYWATRWNEPAGDLRVQLGFLFNAMLQSPEYQLL